MDKNIVELLTRAEAEISTAREAFSMSYEEFDKDFYLDKYADIQGRLDDLIQYMDHLRNTNQLS